MASSVKQLFLSVICISIICSIVCLPHTTDTHLLTDPQEVGLSGGHTGSANIGWNVLLKDIKDSLMTTKLFQSMEGTDEKAIKNLDLKHNPRSAYSSKRSSKCIFGTPNPQYNCGPDLVAKIVNNEYQEFAQKLWRNYLTTKNGFNYY